MTFKKVSEEIVSEKQADLRLTSAYFGKMPRVRFSSNLLDKEIEKFT